MGKGKGIPINVMVPGEIGLRAKRLLQARDQKMDGIVTAALIQFLEEQNAMDKESFDEALRKALQKQKIRHGQEKEELLRKRKERADQQKALQQQKFLESINQLK